MFSQDELEVFASDGLILKERFFSSEYVRRLKVVADAITIDNTSSNRAMEQDQATVRSVYGAHDENDVFQKFAEDPELVEMAMQLVGSSVHVFQFKLNTKRAFIGAGWEWHQDYTDCPTRI